MSSHNLHIYIVVPVCCLLLALELSGIGKSEWIQGATLVTLLILALSTVRDRAVEEKILDKLDRLAASISVEPGVRWYAHRADATTDMLRDMGVFGHLAFLGISHRQLRGYLAEVLQSHRALPWENI